MKNNNFMISERDLGFKSDNLIIYYAGPIKISISGWSECITLSTNSKWKHLLSECLEIAKEAWELDDNSITFKENEVYIKYNFNNIKLYIEHSIIFI